MKLWESMHSHHEDDTDTGSMRAIRTGLNIRDTFWEDFIQVCNNRDGLGELLGISPDQIVNWPTKVKENLEKVSKADVRDQGEEKSKTKVIDTGDNLGGIAVGEL